MQFIWQVNGSLSTQSLRTGVIHDAGWHMVSAATLEINIAVILLRPVPPLQPFLSISGKYCCFWCPWSTKGPREDALIMQVTHQFLHPLTRLFCDKHNHIYLHIIIISIRLWIHGTIKVCLGSIRKRVLNKTFIFYLFIIYLSFTWNWM